MISATVLQENVSPPDLATEIACMHACIVIIDSLDAVNRDSFPRTISVQSSYKLKLPQHLLIHASDIKLVEPIGQGDEMHAES